MVTIRLRRTGKRKEPSFRIIVSDSRKDTVGTYLESLGIYNPRVQPTAVTLNAERAKFWIGQGAQASGTVHNLFVDQGVLPGPKIRVGAKGKKQATDGAATPGAEAAKPADAPAAEPAKA